MRRVREQCVAQRSTEAKRSPQHADPSAARDTPKLKSSKFCDIKKPVV
ncbi:MAG: hypothetical protein NZ455_13025 [Bacteroidia bacterium]|nr:hypothetical protein [Bacteroidia bacterium]MDW8346499.1 hypothetical protein [Bacteroidia bacterium]